MSSLSKWEKKASQSVFDTLTIIKNLPIQQKRFIDGNLKLIGSDLYRNIAELMQNPALFGMGMELPDLTDPKATKSFLYKVQSIPRKARGALNITPSKLSKLITQHHKLAIMGADPAYKGITKVDQMIDQSNRIEDKTGTKPGTHKANLTEILGSNDVHKQLAHGGNYNNPLLKFDKIDPLASAKAVVDRGTQMAKNAEVASQPFRDTLSSLAKAGGSQIVDPWTEMLDPTKAAELRKSIMIGLKKLKIPATADAIKQVMTNPATKVVGLGLGSIPIFGDAADAATGAMELADPKVKDKAPAKLRTTAGATGLASLAFPQLIPVAAGLGIGSTLTDNARHRAKKKDEQQQAYVNALTKPRGLSSGGEWKMTERPLPLSISGRY